MEIKEFFVYRDHLKIGGYVYRNQKSKQPAIIISHGFMANYKRVEGYAKIFADMGYAAFVFDFNGGSIHESKSSGKTVDMSVLTEVKDLEAVLSYIKKLDYVDQNHISLLGCSQGGFVSALAATKHPEVENIILIYPALCIPDDARSGHMMYARFNPSNVPDRIHCGAMLLGKNYVLDVLDMDPFKEIQGYDGHVYIVHGSDDRIVNIDYAKRAYEVYKDRNNSLTDFHIIENAGHSFIPEFEKEITDYLTKHFSL